MEIVIGGINLTILQVNRSVGRVLPNRFLFQLFVTGKELWGHIDGSDSAPTDATKLGEWKIKDARVMTWILGSIDPLIVLNLRPYKTAKAMWDYLQNDYFSGFQNLWAEFTDIVYAKIPTESLSVIQAVHEQSKQDQFLMKLCSDFESVRSNLMNRDLSPSLDVCFRKLLREEQRLVTQNSFKKENDVTVAFATQGKGKGRDMSRTQCYSCKEYGHIASNCSKKFCASNHMTNYTSILKNIHTYQGPSQIQIANGSNIPITKDQVSGTIVAKGPKVGRLFPIRFSIPPVLSFACTSTASKTELLPLIVLLVN
ncbi:hypothetical protein KY285_031957 [Solanum tuberosum]|nr:hypothetical protein KY285_031957 [Solanum tuberosum]